MADSDTAQPDTTQQITSKTPVIKQKNPKRVAAGKAIAAKRKQAQEAQKKAFADAVVENNRLKQQAQADPPAVAPPTDETKVESSKNVLTTTQWLSAISIVVSLAGIYYKREEIKGLLTRPQVPPPAPPNSPVVPRKGINLMD